jgi:hypothetical protein
MLTEDCSASWAVTAHLSNLMLFSLLGIWLSRFIVPHELGLIQISKSLLDRFSARSNENPKREGGTLSKVSNPQKKTGEKGRGLAPHVLLAPRQSVYSHFQIKGR